MMDQTQRRLSLIRYLLEEQPQKDRNFASECVPEDETKQKRILRSLVNMRAPKPISDEFLRIQDEYMQEELKHMNIFDAAQLEDLEPHISLWQGDISKLRCGAIVNAANSDMVGCFIPCHNCVDNIIHTYSGVQLRWECAQIINKMGCGLSTGAAKITKAYNLPCQHVLHTVGPTIFNELTQNDEEALASCYRSCLDLAQQNNVESVAFCCISTGVFRFPNQRAAEIAVHTVRQYLQSTSKPLKVIFNVYLDKDHAIYEELLKKN